MKMIQFVHLRVGGELIALLVEYLGKIKKLHVLYMHIKVHQNLIMIELLKIINMVVTNEFTSTLWWWRLTFKGAG